MINAFIAKRQAAGNSGRTVNLDIIVLRNVLRRAVDDGWIKTLPTENLRPLKWTLFLRRCGRSRTPQHVTRGRRVLCGQRLILAPPFTHTSFDIGVDRTKSTRKELSPTNAQFARNLSSPRAFCLGLTVFVLISDSSAEGDLLLIRGTSHAIALHNAAKGERRGKGCCVPAS